MKNNTATIKSDTVEVSEVDKQVQTFAYEYFYNNQESATSPQPLADHLSCTFCVHTFMYPTNDGTGKNQMVRLAKIKIDPLQLEQYNTALKEQMATAVRVEPGVLTYYAVADKSDPSRITILEIYADTMAYQSHIDTPHFKKYKETVKDMVNTLELVDVTLLGSAKKPDM